MPYLNSLKWKIDEKTRHYIATGASETRYTCVVLGKRDDDQPAWALLIQQGTARYSRCGLESVAAARDLAERHEAQMQAQLVAAGEGLPC